MPFLMIILAAISYSAGAYYMKLAQGFTNLVPLGMVFILFGLGITLQTSAMRHTSMSVTYMTSLGLETVLTFLLGVLFLQEGYSVAKLSGTVLIVGGILLLRSS